MPRPAVRILHARHDDHRPRAAGPQPRPDRGRDPRSDLRPDLPLHRLHHDRAVDAVGGQARERPQSNPVDETTSRRSADRRTGTRSRRSLLEPGARHDHRKRPSRRQRPEAVRPRPDAAQGGSAVHPRPRQLRRRRQPARHAAPGDPAFAVRARPDHRHRCHCGAGTSEGQGRRHRCRPGREGPGVDADAVQRRAGRAGHRQGAVPGPGGGVRRRRGPLLGARCAGTHRRRLRPARPGHRRRARRSTPTPR